MSVPYSFQGNPGPKFDRGAIMAYRVDSPEVFAWDRSGKLLMHSKLDIPRASEVMISDVAVNPSGGWLVAGTARSAESQGAAFIGWLSPAGTIERVVRTSPFAPLRICATGGGTVWAAGRELAPDHLNRMMYVPNHAILRGFDADGQLRHSAVRRESLDTRSHPVDARSILACGSDRIGFFSFPANEWVEVSLEGAIIGRWKGISLSQDARATGINILPGGSVYATSVTRTSATPGPDLRAALFQLDRTKNAWLPVPVSEDVLGTDPKRHYIHIMGTDGRNLVVHTTLPDIVAMAVP